MRLVVIATGRHEVGVGVFGERTRPDEVMLTAMVSGIADRIRSFELIADKVAGRLPGPG